MVQAWDDRTVTDRDQFANESWENCDRHGRWRYPQCSSVADHDAADVTAQDRAVTNARFFADGGVADDGRARNDKRGGVNP
jgi:hypothetical protein